MDDATLATWLREGLLLPKRPLILPPSSNLIFTQCRWAPAGKRFYRGFGAFVARLRAVLGEGR